jgi:hypothetical protein
MNMNDDELIRDAVHELVAAAPPPKPLPMGGAAGGGPYRWLAIAAATILVIGGIVAIAWSQADDDDATPVATTQPAPPPTPPISVATSAPATTSPIVVTSPPSSAPPTVESTSTTTSTSTSTTTTTTVPPTPEQAQIEDYLTALAEGRYDDAARVLNEGGLEPERRADLRPLFTEYGNIDDLPARLQSWCENEADCTRPDAGPTDIGSYWIATWPPDGSLTAYFRSGSFEGSPLVHGLPPRRLLGNVGTGGPPSVGCPNEGVELVREADVDGDGWPETIVVIPAPDSSMELRACNTGLFIPSVLFGPSQAPVVGVLQPASDPAATLLIGESNDAGVCASTYRMAASAGALVQVGWQGCWGPGTGTSIGCRDVNGQSMIVAYQYSYVGGDRPDNSTAMNVDVLSLDGAPLDSFSLPLPDQIDEALQIVEPYCNGLPVMTEG